MSDVVLGAAPVAQSERDAIHVAVIPMKASEMLRPGQRVGIVSEGIAGPLSAVIGIVDPFLVDVVPKDSAFWLCLLPNTVTGMRHEWKHPSFCAATATDPKEDSVAWLKAAAVSLGVDYDTITSEWSPLENDDYINNGEHIRDIWYEIDDEFWKHHAVVTGRVVPEEKRGGFTCSC